MKPHAGGAPRRRGLAFLAALLAVALLRPLHRTLQRSMTAVHVAVEPKPHPPVASPLFAKRTRRRRGAGGKSGAKARDGSGVDLVEQEEQTGAYSDAPLLFHASPGSTGSRTVYHAACSSGFPSVHHKSFCISRHRGIDGVSNSVVEGVRAHYEVLRLYQLAADCCSLWNKGKIKLTEGKVDGAESMAQELCSMPLSEWSDSLQSHLKRVVSSGLVGLFDTPYPYLARQVLDLAAASRRTPPIIAVTERDPEGWAASRTRNHGILVCREEHSYEKLGASEFDVLGCVERAHAGGGEHAVLHFWDAFRYRSRTEPVDPAFQKGMERQMRRHQERYLPLATYAPDFFGVHAPNGQNTTPVKEKDVAVDIRRHILGGKPSQNDKRGDGIQDLQSKRRNRYTQPLTCRGRVEWTMANDTLVEHYHLPKTCEDGDDSDSAIPLMKPRRRNAAMH